MRIRSGIMAATLLLVPVFVYAGLVNISGGKCFNCSSGGGGGGDGQLFFTDNFDSCDLSHTENGWEWTGYNGTATTASSGLLGGTCAARFTFGPNGTGVSDDAWAELRMDTFGQTLTDMWIGYKLYVPSNYTHRSSPGGNNKGWATCWDPGGETTYGSPQVGLEPNFWDDGTGDSVGSFYVFGDSPLGRANDNGGTHLDPGGDSNIFIDVPADRNKVIEVVVHYRYATAEGASANGVAEIWRRRLTPTTLAVETGWTKITDIQDGDWYGGVTQPGFGSCYFLGWANSGFTDQTIMYLGQFWLANYAYVDPEA